MRKSQSQEATLRYKNPYFREAPYSVYRCRTGVLKADYEDDIDDEDDLREDKIIMKFIPMLHSVSYSGSWGQVCLSIDRFIDKAADLGFRGVMLKAKRPHL